MGSSLDSIAAVSVFVRVRKFLVFLINQNLICYDVSVQQPFHIQMVCRSFGWALFYSFVRLFPLARHGDERLFSTFKPTNMIVVAMASAPLYPLPSSRKKAISNVHMQRV